MPEVLVGHRDALLNLKSSLPPAALLLGPEGVGKWSLARVVAGVHGYPVFDTYQNKSGLMAGNVASIQQFAQTAGSTSRGKLVLACLDGSSEPAQQALLKVLEEPPPKVKFLITASEPPLQTVASRCQVIRCGLLTAGQVEDVLILLRYEPRKARAAALMAGGRVSVAVELAESAETVLARVKAALKAASASQPLAQLFRGEPWTEHHHRLLSQWAAEAATRRWRLFSFDDAPLISRQGHARFALTMLTSLEGGNPRLLDRAVLERLAARERR